MSAPMIRRRWRTQKSAEIGRRLRAEAYEAGADALLILTGREEFAPLDRERLRDLVKYPIGLDARICENAGARILLLQRRRPAALREEIPARALARNLVRNKDRA